MRKLGGILLLAFAGAGLWVMSGTINALVLTGTQYSYRQINGVGWVVVIVCALCGALVVGGLSMLLSKPRHVAPILPRPEPVTPATVTPPAPPHPQPQPE